MGEEGAQHPGKWDGTLRRSLDCTTRAIDEDTRSIVVVASTDSLDAHGDILEQNWDLKRYKKNPVVLWHHNRFDSSPFSFGGSVRPEDLLPIGRAENVKVTDDGLEAKLVFASADVNPMADKVFRMFQEGILRAVSVGFKPGKITEEMKDGRTVFRLDDNELREISAVPIPSNPDAVAKSIAWERQNLARMAAGQETASAERTETMNEKELRDEIARLKGELDGSREKVTALEVELKAEKAANERLTKDVAELREKLDTSEEKVIEAAVEDLVGKKITPAERDEYVQLAKDIGLERVQKMAENRPSLNLTDAPLKAGDKTVGNGNGTPEPVETDDVDNGAGQKVVDIVNKRVAG